MTGGPYELQPIGRVESPLVDRAAAPKQGHEGSPDVWLEFDQDVREGLRDLRVGTEIILLTWLDRARRDVLIVHPRDDPATAETGVFSTRSADRPNPIGLHRVEILAIDGTRIQVRHLEALDGTPIVDVKPVLRGSGMSPMSPQKEKAPEAFPESMAWFLDNPIARATGRRLVARLGIRPGMRVLEVGAGPGRLTFSLARKAGASGEVVATDIQEGMLRRIEARARAQGLSNVTTILARAGESGLPADHFDLALLVAVLGEIPEGEREPAFREIRSALKPGAELAVVESRTDPHRQRHEDVRALGERVGLQYRGQDRSLFGSTMRLARPGPEA